MDKVEPSITILIFGNSRAQITFKNGDETNQHSFGLTEGHSVVGDGTTPQMCAMLTGHHEFQLPEARRGFENSSFIDSWPFLFKEFEEMGYKTVYSEDEPGTATFNYRLHGFKDEPTHKYLRTFWLATNSLIWKFNAKSHSCPHELIFNYINDLVVEYEREKLFGLFVFSNVAHEAPNRVGLIDQDLKTFLKTFQKTKKSANTILIVFGDHGSRTSEFRATMQGRLEERLPFFSVTFPRLFREQFPKEMKIFERNTHVLTSFLDIHATLKHLLTFPDAPDTTPHQGSSLFTNVASMNRSCDDAGIETHWCPCLDYLEVPLSSPVAKQLVERIIEYINNMTRQVSIASKLCAVLEMGNIMAVSKHVPNKKVQRFKSTYRDDKCDACGVKYEDDAGTDMKSAVFIVTFSVHPSNGVFEATVDADISIDGGNSTTEHILSRVRVKEISRLNKYGDQPACVADQYPYLRKFCYCTPAS